MSSPKGVVFDLGKVLLDFDYSVAARNIAAHCSLSADAVAELINHSPLLFRYETGLMSTTEFYEEVKRHTQFAKGCADFEPLFADIFSPIEEMIALNERLRARHIPTYIFSNTNPIAIAHIRQKYPFFKNFTAYVLSYEHSAMKPTPSIYEVVEKITGLRGADILYLDDRLENIEAGAARGWHTIHHSAPQPSIQRIAQFGLLGPA